MHSIELSVLHNAIVGFYHPADITAAKKQLMEDVRSMNFTEKAPRLPNRNDNNENRTSMEVDDIIKLLKFLDQNLLLSKMPIYVADGPDAMPCFRLVDGDYKYLLQKMETMDATLRTVINLLNMMHTSQVCAGQNIGMPPGWGPPVMMSGNTASSSVPCGPADSQRQPQPQLQARSAAPVRAPPTQNKQPPPGFSGHGDAAAVDNSGAPAQGTGSSLFRQAIKHHSQNKQRDHSSRNQTNRKWGDASSQSNGDTGDTEPEPEVYGDEGVDGGGSSSEWEYDRHGKRKRRRVRSAEEHNSREQRRSDRNNRSRHLLIGRKQVDTTNLYQLTAAKSLVRKAVYYIDNVDPMITAKDLEVFVNGMGIRVVSCFSATPRRSAEDKRLKIVDKTRHAFRLCINGEDNALMTDPNNWSEGIIVRRWYFMGKDENFNGDGDQLLDAEVRSRSTSVSGATGGAAVADQVLPPSGDLIYQQHQQQQQSTSAAVSETDMDQTLLVNEDGEAL